ncbi:hypothetical protein Fmac_015237 [Flemingia macrophylla]|uniref:Uncharacterized protein n=1 Tax=Flemingia macrophylla TaxID=520843 RepID=A0ABD1ME50_9FABA
MMPLSLEESMMWLQVHLLKLESGRQARCSWELVDSTSCESEACLCCKSLRHPGVHDVAIDTSVEARELEGKLDAPVNLVTQLATTQKPASVARVCGIRSSNDHLIRVSPSSQNMEWMSILRLILRTHIADHHSSRDKTLDREDGSKRLQFSARNYAIVIRGVHDVATDTSAEARKLEGKLDALVNLVTQLVANQKPASVARVCDICSSNDHRTSVCPSSHQSGVDEHPKAYAANKFSRPPQQQRQGT